MRSRILLSGLLLAVSVTVAQADQIPDPIIKTGGQQTNATNAAQFVATSAPVPAGIITSTFTITTPSGTSPATSPCILTQGSITTTSPQCLFENDITLNGQSAV